MCQYWTNGQFVDKGHLTNGSERQILILDGNHCSFYRNEDHYFTLFKIVTESIRCVVAWLQCSINAIQYKKIQAHTRQWMTIQENAPRKCPQYRQCRQKRQLHDFDHNSQLHTVQAIKSMHTTIQTDPYFAFAFDPIKHLFRHIVLLEHTNVPWRPCEVKEH